jgi:cell division septal protein FtsQ
VVTADLTDATTRLRAEPWIATADARRVLPDRIVVDIREFQPAAVVELGDSRYLADVSGHPFKRAEAPDHADLPLVTGIARGAYTKDPDAIARQITRALDVVRSWRSDERPAVSEVRVDDRGLSLISGPLAIQIGDGDVAPRLHAFDVVWGALSIDERSRARGIHLESRLDHVTVAFAKD